MEAEEELNDFTCYCFSFLSADRDISRNPFQVLIVMPRNRGYYFTSVESGFEYIVERIVLFRGLSLIEQLFAYAFQTKSDPLKMSLNEKEVFLHSW